MKVQRRPPPAPHIPFISLADIAWQIIIFFFMAASFTKNFAMKADAPSASDKPTPQQNDEKTLTVVATNEFYEIDKRPLSIDQVRKELTLRLKTKNPSDRAVIIDGKKGLSWQRNAALIYAINKAGGTVMVPNDDD